MLINRERLLTTLRTLLEIDSPTGHEHEISIYLTHELEALGGRVVYDINGNLIGYFPGEGKPLLLNAHMDTIQSTAGIKIVESEERWRTDGTTILGADDKAGLAVILEVIRSLREKRDLHRSIETVFTIGEEIMMAGARHLDYNLISAQMGIGIDTRGAASNIATSAPAFITIEVTITGRAAHAGNAPEKGINAILVAAEAIAGLHWGRIDEETTANVGIIRGGLATNIVPETTVVTMEVRSMDETKFNSIIDRIAKSFQDVANRYGSSVHIDLRNKCRAFKIGEDHEVVQIVSKAAADIGMIPTFKATGGVFDASIFNERGIDTVVLGIGYELNHSSSEYLVIPEFVHAADLLYSALKTD